MDVFIGDDLHNTKKAESDVDRESVKSWWKNVIASRGVIRGVRRAVVMQRVHEDDIVNHIKESEGKHWEEICLPMRYEKDRMKETSIGFQDPRTTEGELLWPEAFSEEKVSMLELQMGSLVSAGQLQQRPAPLSGNLFNRANFEIMENVDISHSATVRSWDIAESKKEGADKTAGVRLADMGEWILIDDVIEGQWSSGERDTVMIEAAKSDGNDTTVIVEQEPGSAGLTFVRHIINLLRGYPCYASRPTGSKIARAMPASAYAEAGKIKLRKAEWNAKFIDQLCVFPRGKHDDMVDAFSSAFSHLASGVNPLPDELIASGEFSDEHKRFTKQELEELPDFLRELITETRSLVGDRVLDADEDGW